MSFFSLRDTGQPQVEQSHDKVGLDITRQKERNALTQTRRLSHDSIKNVLVDSDSPVQL
jgi:hypothetical protein